MTLNDTKAAFLLDNLSTGVLLFNSERKLVFINTAGENLLSVSYRKVVGLEVDEILPNTPFFAEAVKRSLDTQYPYVEWGMEIDLPSLKSIVADCVFTPVMNDDSENSIAVELVDTHSHRRFKREEDLLNQHQTAKESAKALAHEVKNPLGGIRGAAQLLRQELEDVRLQEYTDIVIKEADRLRDLVDGMLTDDRQLTFAPVNVHEVLEYVCNLVEAEVEFDFELYRDYDPSLPELTADRGSLIQVFLNLISNAVQAIEPGGKVIVRTRAERKITIAHVMNRLCLRIDVIDDGSGIAEELVDRIFYPMITSKTEGTGLGLPIAQSLIQQHGGFIEYNRVSKKTVFTVLLPWGSQND